MAFKKKKIQDEASESLPPVNTPRKKKAEVENWDAEPEPVKKPRKPFRIALPDWVYDARTKKLWGSFLLVFALFMALAQISFYFHWQADQSLLEHAPESQKPTANLMGWMGAWLAQLLIFKGFGFSAILLVPIVFRWGWKKLFPPTLRLPLPSTEHFIFFLFWGATFLGFLLPTWLDGIAGGRIGMRMAHKIEMLSGTFGTPLFLGFGLLAYLILAFNIRLIPSRWEEKKPSAEKLKEEEEETPVVPVNIYTHRDELGGLEQEEEEVPMEEISEDDFQVYEIPLENPFHEEPARPLEDLSDGGHVFEISPPVASPTPAVPSGDLTMEVEIHEESKAVEEPSTGSKLAQAVAAELVQKYGAYDPMEELPGYRFPPVNLLADLGVTELKVDPKELEANKNRIVETLRNYGVEIQKIKATIGPTVTLYEIVPAPGVRISKIKNLEDDIALSLAAHGIRIIAPIPGKGTIGIEVPNQNPTIVGLKSIFESEKWVQNKFDLPVALGRTISNEVFLADLAKMPHLLVAGATGQGKSVGINTLLVSLLYSKHPSELKLVMIDPKKVELPLYSIIEKHFLAKLPGEDEPIITDTKKVINTLNSLCIEMDNRYELLKNAQVRNLKEYNERFRQRRLNPNEGHRFLPYIVLVIDEFADLIMTAGKEVELPIARLAQLARAIGIHLIIATQRPSVNIITGTIKANFPARLAFRVSSKVDSRTILDSGGADQLIGRGDMLLSIGSDLIRLQCPFVDTPEVEQIVAFIGEQRGFAEALMLPEYVGEEGDPDKTKFDSEDKDDLFDEAARIIVQHQQGSASLLQRRLNIGYNRAGRLIDQMEAAGLVGPNKGSKAREVLIHDEVSLQRFLDGM